MTIFSIVQSQIMRRAKKPGKRRNEEDKAAPENPDDRKNEEPKE